MDYDADTTRRLAARLRRHAVEMTHRGGSSHVASCLSMADVIAALYGQVLNVDPENPRWNARDRFVLSKGHAGACIYAALAERGFFPVQELGRHYQNGSIFSGHISHKGVPGVEISTGSLGHGLPVATGMAWRLHQRGQGQRVFAVLSDGECDEGSNWEAIMFAAHHGLDNLVVVVDYNRIQSLGPVSETIGLEPFADKWRAFNWSVRQIDGHNHDALLDAFADLPFEKGRPSVILAETTKGKGVSFMEGEVLWHYRSPQGEEYKVAVAELDAALAALEGGADHA